MSASEIAAPLYILGFPLVVYILVLMFVFKLVHQQKMARQRSFSIFILSAIFSYPVVLVLHWKSIQAFTDIDTEFVGFGFAMIGNMMILAISFLVSLPLVFRKLRGYA